MVNEPEEISHKNRIEYPIIKLIDFGKLVVRSNDLETFSHFV